MGNHGNYKHFYLQPLTPCLKIWKWEDFQIHLHQIRDFPGFVAEHVMFQSCFPNLAFFSKKLIKKSLSALENILSEMCSPKGLRWFKMGKSDIIYFLRLYSRTTAHMCIYCLYGYVYMCDYIFLTNIIVKYNYSDTFRKITAKNIFSLQPKSKHLSELCNRITKELEGVSNKHNIWHLIKLNFNLVMKLPRCVSEKSWKITEGLKIQDQLFCTTWKRAHNNKVMISSSQTDLMCLKL